MLLDHLKFPAEQWTDELVERTTVAILGDARQIFYAEGGMVSAAIAFGTVDLDSRQTNCEPIVFTQDDAMRLPHIAKLTDQSRIKDAFVDVVEQMVRDSRAIAVVLALEYWAIPDDEPNTEAWRGRSGQHPRRVEKLQVSRQWRNHPMSVWTARIVRSSDGKPVISDWKRDVLTKPGDRPTSRIMNLLPPVN